MRVRQRGLCLYGIRTGRAASTNVRRRQAGCTITGERMSGLFYRDQRFSSTWYIWTAPTAVACPRHTPTPAPATDRLRPFFSRYGPRSSALFTGGCPFRRLFSRGLVPAPNARDPMDRRTAPIARVGVTFSCCQAPRDATRPAISGLPNQQGVAGARLPAPAPIWHARRASCPREDRGEPWSWKRRCNSSGSSSSRRNW